jgi:hypothetical protein
MLGVWTTPFAKQFSTLNRNKCNFSSQSTEATTVGYIGKHINKINVSIEGIQVDHQSNVLEIEGKLQNKQISILIYPGESLSYISPSLVENCKREKLKHPKSWLV